MSASVPCKVCAGPVHPDVPSRTCWGCWRADGGGGIPIFLDLPEVPCFHDWGPRPTRAEDIKPGQVWAFADGYGRSLWLVVGAAFSGASCSLTCLGGSLKSMGGVSPKGRRGMGWSEKMLAGSAGFGQTWAFVRHPWQPGQVVGRWPAMPVRREAPEPKPEPAPPSCRHAATRWAWAADGYEEELCLYCPEVLQRFVNPYSGSFASLEEREYIMAAMQGLPVRLSEHRAPSYYPET